MKSQVGGILSWLPGISSLVWCAWALWCTLPTFCWLSQIMQQTKSWPPNSHFIWDGMTCRSLSLWNVSIVILASQKENRDVSWGFGKITVAWKWQTGCCPCVENNLKDWSFHLAPSELTLTGYTRLCSVGGWSHLVTSLVYSIHRGKKRSELRKQHELEETIW